MGLRANAEGKGFEAAFKTVAQLSGYRVLKVPEAGRWTGPGAFKPIPGWADFMLIDANGRTAFVDAKSIDGGSFPHSLINPFQLKFLESVGDLCPAGYVVNYRSENVVIFHKWTDLKKVQPGESIAGGVELGQLPMLDISRIFKASRV